MSTRFKRLVSGIVTALLVINLFPAPALAEVADELGITQGGDHQVVILEDETVEPAADEVAEEADATGDQGDIAEGEEAPAADEGVGETQPEEAVVEDEPAPQAEAAPLGAPRDDGDEAAPLGAAPDEGAPLEADPVTDPVAKIGETGYASLQDALNAAHEMTGDVTVTLVADITEVAVVHQRAGLNLTIDGAGKTITGQLYVDGDGRYNDADTLTIQNVKFAYDAATYDEAFIDVPNTKTTGKSYTTGKYNYAHNVTVKNCEFVGSGETTVAFRVASGAGANGVTLSGNTATAGHSFAQLTGVKNLTITGNIVSGVKNGINISGGEGTAAISSNTLEAQGYTVRLKDASGMAVTLAENTFSGAEGIVSEATSGGKITIESGSYAGPLPTDGAKLTVSGGNFTVAPDPTTIAEGYESEEAGDGTFNVVTAKLRIAPISAVTYNGAAQEPAVTVTYGGNQLTKDTDYTVSYTNNTNAGTATVNVAGKDGTAYADMTATANFTIKPAKSRWTIDTPVAQDKTYTGAEITTTFSFKDINDNPLALVEGTDYDVSYVNNTNVGTATATITYKGNYEGSDTVTFAIQAADVADAQASEVSDQFSTGEAITPEVTLTLGDYTLVKGTDYEIAYSDNTNAGKATITITGKDNFTGTKTINFNIVNAVATIGDAKYASLEEAVAAANAMTGDVVINLNGDVTWTTGASHGSTPLLTADSAVSTLTINGNGNTLTAVGQGIGSLRAANGGTLVFNNMTIKDESKSYAENSWEHGYLEFAGKLTFNNVSFVNAVMLTRDNGQAENCDATFTNCSFNSNNANEYDVWVSQGKADFTNCEFTGYRGAKVHEAYGSEVGTVAFNQCEFTSLSKKPGVAVGDVNADTTVVFDTCTFENVQAGDQGLYVLESDTARTDYDLIIKGTAMVDGVDAVVARIGERGFLTIEDAFAAVKADDTLEILKAGTYTLPSSLPNITVQGDVGGVVFKHTAAGNVSALKDGATFKNVTFSFGNVNYHGFQHAGTINMENCTLNGKFFSYGDMNFTNCTFNAPGTEASGVSSSDYSMWAYSGNVTYTGCTFNGAGKFLHAYNESGTARYTVTVTSCVFNNSGNASKAAINVKETCGSKTLQYTVNINDCTTTGNFPATSSSDALTVIGALAQVDDRVAGGTMDGGEIIVNIDDEQAYITPAKARVAAIGETEYVSLADAFAAAASMEGNVTINVYEGVVDLPADSVIPANVTIKGAGTGKTSLKITTTNGDGIKLTNPNVIIQDVSIDGSAITSGGYKSLVNVKADGCVIDNVVFSGGGMSTWNSTILVEGLTADQTFTVKNSTITGSFRGVLRESCNANIVIEGCEIDAIYPFNIDGGNGGTVNVSGSKLHGWTSYSGVDKVTFTNCEFSKGNSGYDVVAAYVDTEFNNCTFDSDFAVYAQTSPFNFTFTGCTKEGVELTRENFKEQFPEDPDVWNKCNTYVDSKLVGAVASITVEGKTTEFKTLQAALDAAHEMTGDVTVTLVADITEVAVIHQKDGLNLTVDGNGKTITGQLYVDGDGRYEGADTLTIQNVKFAYDAATYDDAFIDVPSTKTAGKTYTTGKYNYAHNVTVTGCTFAGEGTTTVAVRVASAAGAHNVVLSDNTATGGHSFAQLTGVKNLTVTGNNVSGVKNGINISGGEGTATISGNTLVANASETEGYTLRLKDASGMAVTLTDNTFSGAEGIISIATSGGTITINSGEYAGPLPTDSTKLTVNGGLFTVAPAAAVCGNGLYPIKNADEATMADYPYTVGKAVASVEELGYTTFEAAATAANGEKTITLLDDIEDAYTLEGGKLIVAHNGKDLTVEAPEGYVLKTTTEGEVTTYEVAGAVAKIGDTLYASLADAIAAVPADGTETTIVMVADETIDVTGYALTIPAGKNVVLDLNGKTVTGACSDASTSALIRNLGTLTINDSAGEGKLIGGADATWTWDGSDDYTGSYASNLIRNEGTLVVNGGMLYNASSGSAAYAIDNYSAGKVTISGGTVDAKKASAIRMFYNNGGAITVTGGTIGRYNSDDDCAYMGIQVMAGANCDVAISGGTIAGYYAFYSNATGGSVVISGGMLDGYVGFGSAGPNNISITDGRFTEWVGTWGDQTGFITGGLFAVAPDLEICGLDTGNNQLYPIANTDAATKTDFPYTIGEAIATVGNAYYGTLAEAVAAAKEGETVKLLKDASGAGIFLATADAKDITIDLDGHKYTVSGPAVGSTGTQNQGMHLEAGNKVTLTNGTLTSTADSGVVMLVQNYCDLTLTNVTLDGSKLPGTTPYTLSNNAGAVTIGAGTTITAKDGGYAFDVCSTNYYPQGAQVTVEDGATINGNVELGVWGTAPADNKATLTINGGTFAGQILDNSNGAFAKEDVLINDGTFSSNPEDNADATYPVAEYPVKVGDVYKIQPSVESPDIEVLFEAATPERTYTYTGSAITPVTGVKVNQGVNQNVLMAYTGQLENGTALVEGEDYELAYADNIDAGTATVTITGKGEFAGTQTTREFKINEATITSVEAVDLTFNGAVQEPQLTVKAGDITLGAADYTFTVDPAEVKNVGTYTVTVKAADNGNYADGAEPVTATFKVNKLDLSNASVSALEQIYTGKAITPQEVVNLVINGSDVTLVRGIDYIVGFFNNILTGKADITIVGINNYSGGATGNFDITAATITSIDAIADQAYTGQTVKPAITVRGANDAVIDPSEYVITYEDNIEAGTANVSVAPTEGNVNVTGNASATFTITAAVARVGNAYYGTLQSAIDAAQEGDTVTLLADVTENITVAADDDITLDLNGHTVTNATRNHTLFVYGKATVKGGTIKSTNNCGICVSGGELTFESGTVEAQEMALLVSNAGKATIDDGAFIAHDNAVLGTNGSAGNGGNEITVNGGTFTGTIQTNGYIACGIYAANNDVWNVNGGTFNITGGAGIVARAGSVNVTGGEFNVTGTAEGKVGDSTNAVPSCAIVFDSSAAYPGMTNASAINVNGGTFTAEDGTVVMVGDDDRIQITGGAFSDDEGIYNAVLPEGKTLAEGEDGYWRITNVYTVTFDPNSEGFEPYNVEVNEGSTVAAPENNPTNGSFSFAGWQLNGVDYDFATPVTSDITLTAKWSEAVAKIGDVTYGTLKAAVTAAKDGETVELLADVTESFFVPDVEETITIDLGGHTLNGSLNIDDGPKVTVTNGTIAGTVNVYGSANDEANHNSFTLASDSMITSDYGIILREAYGTTGPNGFGSTININGTVNGIVWVMGNISAQGDNLSVINVNEGAKVSGNDVGIGLNGAAVVNVKGGTVTGTTETGTGIEVRAGKLNVTGGTITGEGTSTTVAANGNGTTTSGAGIAIAQHNTKCPIEVNVSGGTVTGNYAVYESDPQGNGDSANVTVTLSGGIFIANGGSAVHSEDGNVTIADGAYSDNNADTLAAVPEGKTLVQGEDDLWRLDDQTFTVTFVDADGTTLAEAQIVKTGEVATEPAKPTKDGYVFSQWQLNGSKYNFSNPVTQDITLTAKWTQAVAKIGDTYYASLYSAMNAAKGTTATVELLKDQSITGMMGRFTIPESTNVTLDLGGHTLNLNGGYFTLNGGTLTVDNGTINAKGNMTQEFTVNSGELTIASGATVNGAGNVSPVAVFGPATVNVAGTLTAENSFALAGNGSDGKGGYTVNITDGAVLTSAGASAVYHPNTGTVNISGGTITGFTAVYQKSGTLNVTGGELHATGDATAYSFNGNGANATGDALVVESCGYPGGAPIANITGGTFTSDNAKGVAGYYGNSQTELATVTAANDAITVPDNEMWLAEGDGFKLVEAVTVTFVNDKGEAPAVQRIAKGAMAAEPEAPTAEGYLFSGWQLNAAAFDFATAVTENITLTATWTQGVAEIDGAAYATLEAAVEAAKDGDTIKMLTDYVAPSYVEIKKSVTIDLAGKTISRDGNALLNPMGAGVTLTVKDSVGGGKVTANDPIWVEAGASFVLESGTIESAAVSHNAIYGDGAGAITVNGGNVVATGNKASAICADNGSTLVTINGGEVKTTGESAYAIALFDTATLVVNDGTIEASGADSVAIGDNGNAGNNVSMTINGGTITSAADIAIYKPAAGSLTVTGGTITGATAIYQKSGTLTVTGGTITGNGEKKDNVHSGNGALATGDAIVIESCDYPGGTPAASISGDVVVTSVNAAAVDEVVYEGAEVPAIQISGGTFKTSSDLADTAEDATYPVAMYPVEVEEDTYKVQASLESPDIEVLFQAATPERTYAYTGNAVEPVTGVKIKQGVNQPVTMTHINTLADGVVLDADDYAVTYEANVDRGTATAIITGTNDSLFAGTSTTREFTIGQAAITSATAADLTFNGKVQDVSITSVMAGDAMLAEGDYTYVVEPAEVKAVGEYTVTITAAENSNYTGSVTATFKVTKGTLDGATVTVPDQGFTGKAVQPANDQITVTTADGYVLQPDEFTARFRDNVAVGENTATVTIIATPSANVTGSAEGKFTIVAAVAKIGDTYFQSLPEAIAAAQPGDTVELLVDVEAAQTTISQNLTLDLGGHKLTGRVTADAGEVTVANGTIAGRLDAYDEATVNVASNATVEGQVVVWGDGTYGEDGCKTPTLNVFGTITNTGDAAITTNGTDMSGAVINILEGANVTSTDEIAIYLPSGNATISGGTITGTTAVYQKSGTLSVTGGELHATGNAAAYSFNGNGANATGDALVVENCDYPNGAPQTSVEGGTFISAKASAIGSYATDGNEVVKGFITPDSTAAFGDNSESTLVAVPEGKTLVQGTDGLWRLDDQTFDVTFNSKGGSEVAAQTVKYGETATEPAAPTMDGNIFAGWYAPNASTAYDFTKPVTTDVALEARWTQAVAKVGDALYATLADAIKAAQDGDTVELLADVTENVNVSKSLMIDLGGHQLNGDISAWNGEVIVNNGTIVGRLNAYDSSTVTLDAGATVNGQVVVWGDGTYGEDGCKTPTLNVFGTITNTGDAAISTNGTDMSDPVIVIHDGASVTSTNDIAIYLPTGNASVLGGSITGATAIYQKSGDLFILGGTLRATGPKADFVHNGNGAYATGDALVVESCGYPNGAPSTSVEGGTFISANSSAIGSYAYGEGNVPETQFISTEADAAFSDDSESTYVAVPEGKYLAKGDDDLYRLSDYRVIEVPTAVSGLVYDGTKKTGVPAGDGYTITVNTSTNAGSYTATATLDKYCVWSDGSYEPQSIEWTIAKAPATITVADASKVYGEADPTFSANVTGELNGEELAYTVTRTAGENVGEYEIAAMVEPTADVNANYDVTVTNGTLTIHKATITSAEVADQLYTGQELTPTPVVKAGESIVPTDGYNIAGYLHNKDLGEASIVITGTGNYAGLVITHFNIVESDKTALKAALDAAEAARVATSDKDGFDLEPGTQYVTSAKQQALTDAVNAAQAVYDNPAATAEQISAATNALNDAIATYTPAIKEAQKAVAKIGDTMFVSLQSAIDAAQAGETVELLADVAENVTVPAGKDITLDLGGKTVTNATGDHTLYVLGKATVKGGTVKSTNNCGICVAGGELTLESGNVEAQEMALLLIDAGTATVNGGTLTAVDNAVVGTNGTTGRGGNKLTVNGGTFNGGIVTEGYVACGIYVANDDVVNVSGGTFNITNGAGIVARAGKVTVSGGEFNTTGSATGRVGDSRVVVPCSAVVFDSEAAYPGLNEGSAIAISGGTFVSEAASVSFVGDAHRIDITGGAFSDDSGNQVDVPEGKYLAKGDDGLYRLADYDVIQVPQATELTYNGTVQTGVPAGDGYTIAGNTGTNAGDYTATATLNERCVWSDGTTGAQTIAWSIGKADLSVADVDTVASVTYNGSAQEPTVTVKIDGADVATAEYEVSYENNTDAGTATVTVTAKKDGNYTGSAATQFEILKNESGVTVDKVADQPYTGSAIEPELTVKSGETVLVEDTDYTVEWRDNVEPGAATFVVQLKGNYSGSYVGSFNITAPVARIGETYYATLQSAIDAAQAGETVELLADVTENVTVPAGKDITLDLGGKTVTNATGDHTLYVRGKAIVKGGTVKSTNNCGICVAGGELTLESGSVEAQEMALLLIDAGTATVNGGTLTAVDNAVIGTNGTTGRGGNKLTVNAGTFNGGIVTEGYVACGIYVANDDVVNVSGGTFNITNGAGIVARAGKVTVSGGEFNTTGSATGRVGDSRVVVPCSAIVFDSEAAYPGLNEGSAIAISGGTFTSEADTVAMVGNDVRIQISGGAYSDEAGNDAAIASLPEDRTLVQGEDGYWRLTDVYTVTFDPANGDQSWTVKVASGQTVVEPTVELTWEEHEFRYWELNGTTYSFDTPVMSDITLTAHWLLVDKSILSGLDSNVSTLMDQLQVSTDGKHEIESGKLMDVGSLYTDPETYEFIVAAHEDANKVLEDPYATQEEVDAAYDQLLEKLQSVSDKILTVEATVVPIPEVSSFVFDGGLKTCVTETEYYTVSGNTGTAASSDYVVQIMLKDPAHFTWNDSTNPDELPLLRLWKIEPRLITDGVLVTTLESPQAFTGEPIEFVTSLDLPVDPNDPTNAYHLRPLLDYSVTYINNKEAGTATAIIEGVNNFYGTRVVTIEITGVNKDDLAAELAVANKLAELKTSEDGTDVPAGESYITPAEAAALADAIEAAQAVMDDPDATQAEVDAALAALKDVVDSIEPKNAKVDKTLLEAAIESTDALLETKVSEDGSELAEGTKYVTPEEKQALVDAVAAAQAVMDDPDATQAEVNAAKAALNTAIDTFKDAIDTASVDRSELAASLTDAAADKEGVTASADGADVKPGDKYAPQAAIDELNNAIGTATAVLNDQDASQDDIDAATSALDAAIEKFEEQVKVAKGNIADATVTTSTKTYNGEAQEIDSVSYLGYTLTKGTDYDVEYVNNVEVGTATAVVVGKGNYEGYKRATFEIVENDKTALEKAIADAQTDLKETPISEDGKDLADGTKYLTGTEEQIAALNEAIEAAQAVVDNPNVTAQQIADATQAVKAAQDALDAAKKEAEVDKDALNAAIAAATADKNATPTSPEDLEPGDEYVDQETADTLAKAIADAQAVANDPAATQDDVDEAAKAVKAAQDAFDAAKKVVEEPAPELDTTELEEAIGIAKNDKANTPVLADAGAIDTTVEYVTSQAAQDLQSAIDEAQAVLDAAQEPGTTLTQDDVDAATAAIKDATKQFDNLTFKLVPVYRMYNKKTSEHMWTRSATEYNSCGKGSYIDWRQEGIAWYAPAGRETQSYDSSLGFVYVYRLYDKGRTGDHIYLTPGAEMNKYLAQGWVIDKGAGFWSVPKGFDRQQVVYRQVNNKLNRGKHHYTPSKTEYETNIAKNGWKGEGIKFYVVNKKSS